jgi:hypothetical protein
MKFMKIRYSVSLSSHPSLSPDWNQLHALLDWMEDRVNYHLSGGEQTAEAPSLEEETEMNEDEFDTKREAELKEDYEKITSRHVTLQPHREDLPVKVLSCLLFFFPSSPTVPLPSLSQSESALSPKFQLEPLPSLSSHSYRVFYPTEPDMSSSSFPLALSAHSTSRVTALVNRPVLANGGLFEITASANGRGVECIFQSLDPERTATAIGERLAARSPYLSHFLLHHFSPDSDPLPVLTVRRIVASRDGSTVGADVCVLS